MAHYVIALGRARVGWGRRRACWARSVVFSSAVECIRGEEIRGRSGGCGKRKRKKAPSLQDFPRECGPLGGFESGMKQANETRQKVLARRWSRVLREGGSGALIGWRGADQRDRQQPGARRPQGHPRDSRAQGITHPKLRARDGRARTVDAVRCRSVLFRSSRARLADSARDGCPAF